MVYKMTELESRSSDAPSSDLPKAVLYPLISRLDNSSQIVIKYQENLE